jgi:hypothetical protein
MNLPAILLPPPGGSVPLNATAASGLPVQYSVVGPATISGNQLTVTGPGDITVIAYQEGDSVWDSTGPMLLESNTAADLYYAASAAAGLSGSEADPLSTPFGDGTRNLLKYAFNMDLAGSDSHAMSPGGTSGLPGGRTVEDAGQHYWRVEFVRRRNSGLSYSPMKSTTLAPGSYVPMTGTETVTPIDAAWERVVIDEPYDPSTTRKLFSIVEVSFP